jgi:hypothetical protein
LITSFELVNKLNLQIGVFDFITDINNNIYLVEISYGYTHEAYNLCTGFCHKDLLWHEGKTIKEEWMVELMNKVIEK